MSDFVERVKAARASGCRFRDVTVCHECADGLSIELGVLHESGAVEWGQLYADEACIFQAWAAGRLSLEYLLDSCELASGVLCDDCYGEALGSDVVRYLVAGLRAEGVRADV